MIVVIGDVFKSGCDFVGFTSNSTLNSRGELVMGAGNAKAAKDLYPDLPYRLGAKVKSSNFELKDYGVLKCGNIFAFQTKRNWRDKTHKETLSLSTEMLKDIAERYYPLTFAIPFPAINHGGWCEKDVLSIINVLPDNVFVYKL